MIRMFRLMALILGCAWLSGCTQRNEPAPQESFHARIIPDTTVERLVQASSPPDYDAALSLADNEVGMVDGIPYISSVNTVTYNTYLDYRAHARIQKEVRRNGFLYFAVDSSLHVHFDEDLIAHMLTINRFKTSFAEDAD